MDIGGYPVIINDTAGIRQSNNPIEEEGIGRTIDAAAEADIVIFMCSACDIVKSKTTNLNEFLTKEMNTLLKSPLKQSPTFIYMINKIDLVKSQDLHFENNHSICFSSCLEHHGLDTFYSMFKDKVKHK